MHKLGGYKHIQAYSLPRMVINNCLYLMMYFRNQKVEMI